jgi:hypothetical protein
MQCPNHPDLPARYRCEKYDVEMCERCMKCRTPKIHCKHREQCIIWKLVEEEFEADAPDDEKDKFADKGVS